MDDKRRPVVLSGAEASGRDSLGSNLMAMLLVGLVLVVVGAVAVMTFV